MAGIERIKPQKAWTESNYDNFSQLKNRNEKAYNRFKEPCFFQKIGGKNGKKELDENRG